MAIISENYIGTNEEREKQHKLWIEIHTNDCICFLISQNYKISKVN